ncbi:hypothetical protein CsSME_00031468 [Camellia sinensis var. sinensis]
MIFLGKVKVGVLFNFRLPCRVDFAQQSQLGCLVLKILAELILLGEVKVGVLPNFKIPCQPNFARRAWPDTSLLGFYNLGLLFIGPVQFRSQLILLGGDVHKSSFENFHILKLGGVFIYQLLLGWSLPSPFARQREVLQAARATKVVLERRPCDQARD